MKRFHVHVSVEDLDANIRQADPCCAPASSAPEAPDSPDACCTPASPAGAVRVTLMPPRGRAG